MSSRCASATGDVLDQQGGVWMVLCQVASRGIAGLGDFVIRDLKNPRVEINSKIQNI